jgi:hypothetical protein
MSATVTPQAARTRRWPVVADGQYEGSRIPSRVPTVLDVPADLRESEDVLQVNFGPNHPSTHGVLRLIVDLHGEEVVGVEAVVGYLHTGFEKSMESTTSATRTTSSSTCWRSSSSSGSRCPRRPSGCGCSCAS